MRSAAWTFFLCSAFALQLGCGDSGGDDTTTTTMSTPSSLPLTSETNNDTGTATDPTETPPTSGVTDTSATSSPATETDPATTDTMNTSTTVDPSTSTTTNPVTTNETSLSSSEGGVPCEEIEATLTPIPPNIMLVLDKSGSMVSDPSGFWDHDNDPGTPNITRWNSLFSVVQDIVNSNEAKMNFGAVLFPSKAAVAMYNQAACPVNANPEVAVGPMNAMTILSTIPQAGDVTIKGGTPSAAGMTTALNHLKNQDPNIPRAVLLITDGAANCRSDAMTEAQRFETYDMSLHTIVGDAFGVDEIPTYVIGIDIKNMTTAGNPDGTGAPQDGNPNGINPYEKLNELATLGGKPKADPNEKFYNTINQIELQAALDAIVGDALSCVIPLDSEPAFPDDTEVLVGGVKVPKVMDCANENGWVYTNPMGPYNAIELCGTACSDLKIAGEADVNFYCSAG